MVSRNNIYGDEYPTDPYLENGESAWDIEVEEAWEENEDYNEFGDEVENGQWSFEEENLQVDYYEGDSYPLEIETHGNASSWGMTLIPWPGFLYGITLAVCVMLGGLLYMFTASSPIGESRTALIPAVENQSAAPASDSSEASDQKQDSGSECRVSKQFPQSIQQWCGLITEQAEQRGLPPDLVAALILQESGGNPSAYSRSGAVGLMQVMPRDGLAASFMCVNGPCFADRPSTEELQDPTFNISYGTRMLAGLVNKRGSYREALKSYGPMNVGYYYADIVLRLFQRYGVN